MTRRSCALALALCGALADEDVFVNVPAAPVTEWAQHLVLKLLCTLGAACVAFSFLRPRERLRQWRAQHDPTLRRDAQSALDALAQRAEATRRETARLEAELDAAEEREARELERRELAALGAAAKNASEGEAAEDAAFRTAFSVASIQDRDQLRCISAPVGRMYPRELSVTCPPGIGAGTTVLVHSPDGRISQARMRARVSHPREGYRLTRFPPDSQVVVPTGVTVGGVFGVPIAPTELQLAYERELENQAKEEEEEDSKPRARSGYEVSDYKIADYDTQDYKIPEYKSVYDD